MPAKEDRHEARMDFNHAGLRRHFHRGGRAEELFERVVKHHETAGARSPLPRLAAGCFGFTGLGLFVRLDRHKSG